MMSWSKEGMQQSCQRETENNGNFGVINEMAASRKINPAVVDEAKLF
jgi:hypothetical protein